MSDTKERSLLLPFNAVRTRLPPVWKWTFLTISCLTKRREERESYRRKDTTTFFHAELWGRIVTPPAFECRCFDPGVSIAGSPVFVHESSTNASRTRVQVLVGAPDGKIDGPVMQIEGNISNSMSQINSDNDVLCMSSCRQFWNVEQLSSVILDPRDEKDCNGITFILNRS